MSKRIMTLLHGPTGALKKGAPISPPIVSTAKYHLPGLPDTPYTYGRDINPTVEAAEQALSALEAAPVIAFPSGMAAIMAALMIMTRTGSKVLLPADGYYVTRALADEAFAPRGVEITCLDTADYAQHDFEPYDLVWIETPSNPGLELCDIEATVRRAQSAGARTIVDNTTLTPFLQRPLDLGADMVISSDTKALAGHSDTLFGHVASRDEGLIAQIRQWRSRSGSIPGPFAAFLVHRGLMTAELRLQRMCSNAAALYEQLLSDVSGPGFLQAVRYPGLGFILGLEFGSADHAEAFMTSCPAIFPSTSFGGVHTSAECRARWGDKVSSGYVRLSVGCEPETALLEAILTTLRDL